MDVAYMSGRPHGANPIVRRLSPRHLILVLVLLAGLLAMHGLSGHHGACTADHVESAAGTLDRPTVTGVGQQGQQLSSVGGPTLRAAVAVAATTLLPVEQCHRGAAACVAVLTALLLLAPLLRRALARRPAHVVKGRTRLAFWFGHGPPSWLAPSPFVLCQLRN